MTQPKSKEDREAGVLSGTAESYMLELMGEQQTGRSDDGVSARQLDWGNRWEPHARNVYQDVSGHEVKEAGFRTWREDDRIGATPDGFIGNDGGFETKCPYTPREHMRTVIKREVPQQYIAQVQGGMWVCEREWWDFVSFDPRIEDLSKAIVIVRAYRDEKFIGQLQRACLRLLEEMENRLAALDVAKAVKWTSESHRVAHLLAPPMAIHWRGEIIEEFNS